MNVSDKYIAWVIWERVRCEFLLSHKVIGQNIHYETAEIPIIVPPKGVLGFPSDTVVQEYIFGLLSDVGRSLFYSRGDHTHGTPSIFVDGVTITGTGNEAFPLTAFLAEYQKSFLVSDWVGPSIGFYSITFQHNLGREVLEVEVWDAGNRPVDVERDITDINAITLRVPYDPDCRFQGFIWIKEN